MGGFVAAALAVALVGAVLPGSGGDRGVAHGLEPEPEAAAVDALGAGGPASLERAALDVTGWRVVHTASQVPDPAAGDGIGPGSLLVISMEGGAALCTANYLWEDRGGQIYLGTAGHCLLPPDGDDVATGPADFDHRTQVRVCVADCAFGGHLGQVVMGQMEHLGDPVYARQADEDQQVGQDFGLVEVPQRLHGLLRPELPEWGGPSADSGEVTAGAGLCTYGNGLVVGETFLTKARSGLGTGEDQGGTSWSGAVPSAPGDSGAAVATCPPLTGGTGEAAVGLITHIGTGGAVGTTENQAIALAHSDARLTISPLLRLDGTGGGTGLP